ncbi:MAG TPA: hypothetical protein VGF97_10310 [Rhizomicrobium sp.]
MSHKDSSEKPESANGKGSARGEIGEGNYTASRNFDRKQADFVKAHKTQIPDLGKQAEAALDGKEGEDLRRAEDEARSHAHAAKER